MITMLSLQEKIDLELESATSPLNEKMIKEFFDRGGKESDIEKYLDIFFGMAKQSQKFIDKVDAKIEML